MKNFTPGRIVMCPPTYYKLPAVENPHMDVKNQPDLEIAWKQWIAIRNLYEMLGVKVFEVEPHPRLHSMVFAANGAWGVNNESVSEIVLSNFVNPTRQGEEEYFGRLLRRLGCDVFKMPDNVFFEGQGDVITTNNCYLLGTGQRTDRRSGSYLGRLLKLDKPIVELELVSDRFYHLDTCLMSLRGKNLLIFHPGAFSDESLDRLRSLDVSSFEINERFAMKFVANSVFVGDHVLLNVPFENVPEEIFSLSASGVEITDSDPRLDWITNREAGYSFIVNHLRYAGYRIIPVFTSAYRKSGAGVRCLTLFVD